MDSEEMYIAALKEKACELVETAMKNAQESLRSLQTVQGEESVKGTLNLLMSPTHKTSIALHSNNIMSCFRAGE